MLLATLGTASYFDVLLPDGRCCMVAGGCGPSSFTSCVFLGCHSSSPGLVKWKWWVREVLQLSSDDYPKEGSSCCAKVVTHLMNMSSRLCTGLGAPWVKKRELYSQGYPSLEVEAHRSLQTVITYCSQSKDASKVESSSVEGVRNYLSMGSKLISGVALFLGTWELGTSIVVGSVFFQ